MSKIGRGRKRGTPGSTTSGSGDPEEAAAFIAETSGELSKVARRHGLDMLGNLLDMAQLEAQEWLRRRRSLS